MTQTQIIQTLLRCAIAERLKCEYMPDPSPAKRNYYEGRIATLLQCLTEDASSVLAEAVRRYTTEKHAPGDDITYPEGTSVQWLRGCIQAAQDVTRASSCGGGFLEQHYDSPLAFRSTKEIFDHVAALVAARLVPTGRAEATAATLRQIGSIAFEVTGLTMADVKAGYEQLSIPRSTDDPPIIARRKTCGEIAAGIDATGGDASKLAAVLERVYTALSASEDPRQRAMAVTAAREVDELQEGPPTPPPAAES